MAQPDDLDVHVDGATRVATVEIRRPPNNYFDTDLIRRLADAFEHLDAGGVCHAIVLCAAGKHFCAGRDFSAPRGEGDAAEELYGQATRLVAVGIPWIAAVQGAAVGGGLGLAMAADLRVAGARTWLSANFAKLGIHHGFGLSVTLPAAVGRQHAAELLFTGRRVGSEEALAMGLVDRAVAAGSERAVASALAAEIAAAAPLAVRSIRATLRGDLVDRFRSATMREAGEQTRLRSTADHREGVAAARERRPAHFEGR